MAAGTLLISISCEDYLQYIAVSGTYEVKISYITQGVGGRSTYTQNKRSDYK
jgi:hypothetical protein